MKNNNGKSKTQINNNINSKDKQKKQTFITDFTNKENVLPKNNNKFEDFSTTNYHFYIILDANIFKIFRNNNNQY